MSLAVYVPTAIGEGFFTDEANYARVNGSRAMATSQAQTFTNGIVTGKIAAIADSTNAGGFYRANGTTQDIYYDSTNGRFGIGAIPAYKLQVGPSNAVNANTVLTGGDLRIGEYGDGFGYLQARDDSGTSSIALQFRTQNAGSLKDSLLLDANGKVVLANNLPLILRDNTGTDRNVLLRYLDDVTYVDANVFQFRVNDLVGLTDAMTLTATARLGIGTASPNNKLDVAGTIQADGLRLDVTPTAETPTATHTITISANGTNYKLLCVAA